MNQIIINRYEKHLDEILECARHSYSNKRVSDWAEEKMYIKTGNYPGRLNLDRTPYSRQILNDLHPFSGKPEICLMGSAQWGKSKTIVEPSICYWISEYPVEMGYLTGHQQLTDEAMIKLDLAIDNANLRHLIRASSLKLRNARTGDTNTLKEFPPGSLVAGVAGNHKILRQRSWHYTIVDDLEAAKLSSTESGDTIALIRERASSFGKRKKILWVSTPELKGASLIEELFMSGDMNYYHIPCPCCGTAIPLEWDAKNKNGDRAGIFWKENNLGRFDPKSVGYICQECAGFFTDKKKYEFNLAGEWVPTIDESKTPEIMRINPEMTSYHLNGLYAMPGATSWAELVNKFKLATPNGQRNDSKLKTFYNLNLGMSYESSGDAPDAQLLQLNECNYTPWTVPEKLSISHGNGRIVMITMGADLNGKVEDARLDWQIIAHSESGATYAIAHGSIGTFVPAIIRNEDYWYLEEREKWTYEFNAKNSVWPEFEKILKTELKVIGNKPRSQNIMMAALDVGNTYKDLAYKFLDKINNTNPFLVQGVKGRSDEHYFVEIKDAAIFKPGREVANLWILEVGLLKDKNATNMQLNWNKDDAQPPGFMNFPQAENGMFGWSNYYAHFQSEKRVIEANKTGSGSKVVWQKVNAAAQNHQLDCHLYNMAIRDICVQVMAQRLKLKDYNFTVFAKNMAESYEKRGL